MQFNNSLKDNQVSTHFMKINGWPEAEERFHSCLSQREVHQLTGMRGYTLNRAQRELGSDEDHLSLPSLNQPKDTNPKDTRPHISNAYKITLLPSTSVSIAEPSSQHPEAGERMEYILAHASLYIYKIKA